MIRSYDDMCAYVREKGVVFLFGHPYGLASLYGAAPEDIWFTGLENDPWQWKDRAPEERRLAYMKAVTARPAFISKEVLPYAIAYYGSAEELDERYSYGEVSTLERDIYDFLDEDGKSAYEIKKRFMRNKKDESGVESAIVRLQRSFDICSAGSRQKLAADGHPYGWPSMVYMKITDWSPEAYEASMDISGKEAERFMTELFLRQNPELGEKELAALLKKVV